MRASRSWFSLSLNQLLTSALLRAAERGKNNRRRLAAAVSGLPWIKFELKISSNSSVTKTSETLQQVKDKPLALICSIEVAANLNTRAVFSGITSSQASIQNSNSFFFNKTRICNLITGHRNIKGRGKPIDYNLISQNGGKIIIYMGVGQSNEIVLNLLNNGIKKNEKVTLVYNATLMSQRLFYTNLGECGDLVRNKRIKSPVIIIIR